MFWKKKKKEKYNDIIVRSTMKNQFLQLLINRERYLRKQNSQDSARLQGRLAEISHLKELVRNAF